MSGEPWEQEPWPRARGRGRATPRRHGAAPQQKQSLGGMYSDSTQYEADDKQQKPADLSTNVGYENKNSERRRAHNNTSGSSENVASSSMHSRNPDVHTPNTTAQQNKERVRKSRPTMEVYVPRARRQENKDSPESRNSSDTRRRPNNTSHDSLALSGTSGVGNAESGELIVGHAITDTEQRSENKRVQHKESPSNYRAHRHNKQRDSNHDKLGNNDASTCEQRTKQRKLSNGQTTERRLGKTEETSAVKATNSFVDPSTEQSETTANEDLFEDLDLDIHSNMNRALSQEDLTVNTGLTSFIADSEKTTCNIHDAESQSTPNSNDSNNMKLTELAPTQTVSLLDNENEDQFVEDDIVAHNHSVLHRTSNGSQSPARLCSINSSHLDLYKNEVKFITETREPDCTVCELVVEDCTQVLQSDSTSSNAQTNVEIKTGDTALGPERNPSLLNQNLDCDSEKLKSNRLTGEYRLTGESQTESSRLQNAQDIRESIPDNGERLVHNPKEVSNEGEMGITENTPESGSYENPCYSVNSDSQMEQDVIVITRSKSKEEISMTKTSIGQSTRELVHSEQAHSGIVNEDIVVISDESRSPFQADGDMETEVIDLTPSKEADTKDVECPEAVTDPATLKGKDSKERLEAGDKKEKKSNATKTCPKVPVADRKSVAEEGDEEEDTWDALFDDEGEALDPSLMSELKIAVGPDVEVEKPQFDYLMFQPKDPDLDYAAYEHLIEVYDFSKEFITRDLIMAFRDFQDKGFDIKWVDDTHAIGVFSSSIAAHSALQLKHPMLRVRPLSQATRATKMKAKRTSEFLQPYKARPETVASVARSLVAGALGLQSRVPREVRAEERRKLQEAKEKKREARRLKEDTWDGKIGKCAMADA